MDRRPQRIKENVFRVGADAVRQEGESVFNSDKLIGRGPAARSVVLAFKPELIAICALDSVDMDFHSAAQDGLTVNAKWEVVVALYDSLAEPLVGGRLLGPRRRCDYCNNKCQDRRRTPCSVSNRTVCNHLCLRALFARPYWADDSYWWRIGKIRSGPNGPSPGKLFTGTASPIHELLPTTRLLHHGLVSRYGFFS